MLAAAPFISCRTIGTTTFIRSTITRSGIAAATIATIAAMIAAMIGITVAMTVTTGTPIAVIRARGMAKDVATTERDVVLASGRTQ